MRVRNQEYLDKLKYMITYRESKISEKIQSIERASSQREYKLKKVAEMKEQKNKQRKDDS
jgi:16S rRNA G527 N7-methylase RsmG